MGTTEELARFIAETHYDDLPAEVVAAYDAPFPTAEHKAGARAFPGLIPQTPDDPATPASTS